MNNCSMKRGFFFLRPCDHPARNQCSQCGQSFCDEHLRIRPGAGLPVCLDCLGKKMQRPGKTGTDDDSFEPAWSYGYRRNYYADGYQPWYFGRQPRRNANDGYDVRAFDNESEDGIDDGPDGEAGSFDS
ncbi:MAG TPA: hypothetical protein PKM56_19250 [Candidatus Rifleibacterium sp.]|nr:hypothetical protein [Candidatus Rifleibacterium sp.]